jgi:hypothetical protein
MGRAQWLQAIDRLYAYTLFSQAAPCCTHPPPQTSTTRRQLMPTGSRLLSLHATWQALHPEHALESK